ncbi:glycosyltransferase [Pedobacter chinensis]|nr:glycosyltransferase [Pedobacter chinensis]
MRFSKIHLLESQEKAYFLDGIKELYNTIQKDNSILITRKIVTNRRIKSYLVRKLVSVPCLFGLKFRLWNNRKVNFAALISGDFSVLIPHAFYSQLNFVYMHDVWPRFQYWIFPLLDLFNIRHVFFSSKQVWADHLKKFPKSRCQSMWLPEGIDANEYSFRPYHEKKIDVLEFGRRYEKYHLLIKDRLGANSKYHVYKHKESDLLFQEKSDLVEALAGAKIVICTPSNITHPERSEYISSMTLRYLQAMASKCLIVGITPLDMQELFDYQTIVEIDMENAAEQLLEVLSNYDSYFPLIERNYLEVRKNHQWINRWDIIKQKIEEVK